MILLSKLIELLQVETVDPPTGEVGAWLNQQEGDMVFLLAHTTGGIVWGRKLEGGWQLSSQETALSTHTLLEMRLFGLTKEILVWKDRESLVARQIVDTGENSIADSRIEESQILWGTALAEVTNNVEPPPSGFTLMQDGVQGLRHAVPLPTDIVKAALDPNGAIRPLRLHLCHYLIADKETGLARIAISRLKGVSVSSDQHQTAEEGV